VISHRQYPKEAAVRTGLHFASTASAPSDTVYEVERSLEHEVEAKASTDG